MAVHCTAGAIVTKKPVVSLAKDIAGASLEGSCRVPGREGAQLHRAGGGRAVWHENVLPVPVPGRCCFADCAR